MADFCTCGTELVADALFCHKCGKPQREIPVVEVLPPPAFEAPPPAAPVPSSIAALNFHNRFAVRVALLVAVAATLLTNFVPFLNWIAAGFFAVFFYKRKTGNFLNAGDGVRMGWITGLLMFTLWALIFIAQQLPAAISGTLNKTLLDQLQTATQDPMVRQMMTSFIQRGGALWIVLMFLPVAFCFIIGLSMAGGALGAKMVGRD